MYLFKKELKMSYPEIGAFFKRDHTTALYAFKKISDEIKSNSQLSDDLENINSILFE